jgi:RNA polymerase sigma-70 factor (ECF subfamily)
LQFEPALGKLTAFHAVSRPAMHTTPISLLERVRQPADQEAWSRFVELYTPLLFHWTCRAGLSEHDAADLVQDVFLLLLKELPKFEYQPQKSFRAWLRTVMHHRWQERLRRRSERPVGCAEERLTELPARDGAELFDLVGEEEYRNQLVAHALRLMQTDFEEQTWRACWEFVVSGKPAAQVAREMNLTPKAVYMAKARVLQRLRQELAGLIDD